MKYRSKKAIAAILAILSVSLSVPVYVFAEENVTPTEQGAVEFIRFTGKQKLEAGKSYYIDTKLAVVGNFTIPEGVYIEIREGGRLRTKSEKGRIFVKGEIKVDEGGTLAIEQGDITVYKGSSIEIAGEMRIAEDTRIRSQGELTFTGTSIVSVEGEMRLYKDGIMTVSGDLTFGETATFRNSASVTITETGKLDNQGTTVITVSGIIENSGEVIGNPPEGKPIEEQNPADSNNATELTDSGNAPAPTPMPTPAPTPNPDNNNSDNDNNNNQNNVNQDDSNQDNGNQNGGNTPPPAPTYTGSLYHTEAAAVMNPTNFDLFNEHFPTAALRLRDAYNDDWQTVQSDADELDAAYLALVRIVEDNIEIIFDPTIHPYVEEYFTPETWALFEPDYTNLKNTYDDSFTLIEKINFLDDAKDLQDKLVYKGLPANYDKILEILLTYTRDSWFYNDSMDAFDALKTAEANLKIGADFDVDSGNLAALCDTAYETFVNTLKSNFAHYLSDNTAFNLFKTQTTTYLQSEYDAYIAISVNANPTIAEMTDLMNAVNAERRTGITVTKRTIPLYIDDYTYLYDNRAAITAVSLEDEIDNFIYDYNAWTVESSAENATELANAYKTIEGSINEKYLALISNIDEYDNPTGIVYEPTSLAALKQKFASYTGVNTTLLERAELIALSDAVKYKAIPSGLTVADLEYLYGQSGLSGICTAYAAYKSAYEVWNGYYTDDSEQANEKAALVDSTYITLEREIGAKFAEKQTDYEAVQLRIVQGYYTDESADVFNNKSFIGALISGDASLSMMIEIVLNYDSEKGNLVESDHPVNMLTDGLLFEINAITTTEWNDEARAYIDAFNAWKDGGKTQALANAADAAYAAFITNGIDKELADKKAEANTIIANEDEYSKGYRDELSSLLSSDTPEDVLLQKITKTTSFESILTNKDLYTYEARWAAMKSTGYYSEYFKGLGYTWENNKDQIRDIVDGIDTSYLSHPDVSYSSGGGYIQTFIGAQNVVLSGNIPTSLGSDQVWSAIEVFESTNKGGVREKSSKWLYNYNENKWYALSGNDTNFTFTPSGDNFNYIITIGTFNQKTYIQLETGWTLPDGNWTPVS